MNRALAPPPYVMNRLRNRLILVFLLATLVPLGLTLWTGLSLLKYSLSAPLLDLNALSGSLQATGTGAL